MTQSTDAEGVDNAFHEADTPPSTKAEKLKASTATMRDQAAVQVEQLRALEDGNESLKPAELERRRIEIEECRRALLRKIELAEAYLAELERPSG